jgi:hypothetical protein
MTGRGATNGHGGLRGAGKAKGRASLKLRKKGQSGNKCGRPKDLDNFGNLLMKEFYKTLPGRDGRTADGGERQEFLPWGSHRSAVAVQSMSRSP